MSEVYLGIDVGTSSVKAVAAGPDGRVVASAGRGYPTAYPRPGWAEQSPEDWWQAVVAAVRELLSSDAVDPGAVAGIGVSGQGCAVALVGADGRVVRPAVIWMDSRSEAQCRALRECCAGAILDRNGKQPAPYNADPALMWLLEHEPEAIDEAAVSLTTTGYVNYRLTGEAVTNVSDASILFAFDLRANRWSDELIEGFGLPRRLYPALAGCTEVIGRLGPDAAAALGLPRDVPVVGGGEDTSSAGLAMGVVEGGQTLLSLGTAGTVYVAQRELTVHPRLLAFRHVVDGLSLLGGSMGSVGGALAWLQETLGGDRGPEELVALAEGAPVGAGGVLFLPYLTGELQPINDGNARGVFFGLSRATGVAELARAVLEGTAFAVAHNLAMAADIGVRVAELRAVGGPTRSPLWCQIIADVTGIPVSVMEGDAGAPLGDALLAAAGVQGHGDAAPAAARAARPVRTFAPGGARHERYQRLLAIYMELYPRLKDLFGELAEQGEATA